MGANRNLVRHAELVALVNKLEPPGYDLVPKNRKQRRLIARALRKADRQASKKG